MTAKFTFPQFDRNLDEIKRNITKVISKKFVTVGVHSDDSNRKSGNESNAYIGAINHFGTDDIPARPWLDVGFNNASGDIFKIASNAVDDGADTDKMLEIIGVESVAAIQEYLTNLQDPPNAQSTKDAKGSSNPLIDTGQLRASISYEITSDAPSEGL